MYFKRIFALQIFYCFCMVSMVKQELLKTSCYKIMFFLGFLDMCSLLVNSVMTGYFAIQGAVFCTNPVILLTLGAFGCGKCSLCILLKYTPSVQ